MRPAIDAVRETGTAVAEVAMSYTGDLSDPGENLYTLDYYLKLAEQIVDAGAHVLAIKDMAGLLRPQAATALVSALRSRFDLPVHVHTHDTPGGQLATYLAAWQAGASAVDGAAAPLGGHHQPARAELDRGRRRAHRVRHRVVAVGGVRAGAVLGGAAKGVRALRIWAARADRAGVSPRDSRRPAVEPAAAGHRTRAGGPVRGHRGELRRRRPDARPAGEGDAVVEGGRRPRVGVGRGGRHRRRIRRRPSTIRHSGLGHRVPARRAGRPARRLAGTVAHQGAGRPRHRPSPPRSSPPTTRRRSRWPGPTRQADAEPAAVPRSDKGIRRPPRALRRHVEPVGQPVLLRAAPRRRAPGQARARRRAADRARGDLRTRRTRHAHRDVHPQRSAAAGGGARSQHRQRGARRGEGRPVQPRPRRGAVRRRRHRRGRLPATRSTPDRPSPPSRR